MRDTKMKPSSYAVVFLTNPWLTKLRVSSSIFNRVGREEGDCKEMKCGIIRAVFQNMFWNFPVMILGLVSGSE